MLRFAGCSTFGRFSERFINDLHTLIRNSQQKKDSSVSEKKQESSSSEMELRFGGNDVLLGSGSQVGGLMPSAQSEKPNGQVLLGTIA